jgi:hypothetical protein
VARALGARGQPGAAVRRRVRAHRAPSPVFWRGRAEVADLLALAGASSARRARTALFEDYARQRRLAARVA